MSVHKLKNGKWCFRKRITLSDGTVKNIQRTYKTKKEAQLQEQLYKISNNEVDDVTFNDVWLHYIDYKKSRLKQVSIYNLTKLFDTKLLPYFGTKLIVKITTQDIINWQKEIEKTVKAPSYKAKCFTYLKAVLQHAVKHFDLDKNPALSVENFRKSRADRRGINFWTYKEFDQFINVVDNPVYNLFFTLLYFTGIRRGECQALNWTDINWETKTISINKTLSPSNGIGHAHITSPKNKNAYRDILLSDDLYKRLKVHYDHQNNVDGFNVDCFIFGTNRFLSHSNIKRYKDFYCELAKVKQIRIHDFRHSFASMMINMDVDIYVLSKMLGHAGIEETTNTYGHLYPSKQIKIVEKLNNREYTKMD